MLTLNFEPFPLISTERLILRKLVDSDAPEILILRSDESILKYIDIQKAKSIDDALAFIHKINTGIYENEWVYWGIALKGSEKLIGTISLWNIIKEHYRGEIGFVLHPDHQGKGLMQEAINGVLEYAFSKMKLHSIEAKVHPANAASIKVLERTKFVREAYFKEDYYCDGKFGDTAVYSILSKL